MLDFFQKQDVIVVFDTEFTTWEGAMERNWSGESEHRELVQIAAQKISLQQRKVLDSFECLVKPTINPQLSKYFVDLTAITQSVIDQQGVSFKNALDEFLAWIGDCQAYSYSMRADDYADADVLRENCTLNNISKSLPDQFGNLHNVFSSHGVDTTGYNSGRLYQAFGLDLAGHEHNAMFDVHSLVQSLFALQNKLYD